MSEQLELFHDAPFSLRIPFGEGLRIFRVNYWDHLPFGAASKSICLKLLTFFKGHYLDSIAKGDVERMRRFYKEMGYSDSYVNKIHMTLSRLFTWWFESRDGKFLNGNDISRCVLPAKNPASLVPRADERRFARKLEITKERKLLLCSVADPDLTEIIDALWWTMLRQGDLFSITSGNVNLDQMTITGTQKKTDLPYKVTIPSDRVGMIQIRLDNTKTGTPLFRRTNLQKRWHECRRKATYFDKELLGAQLRDIRGGAASFLLDNGTDLETLRKKGGWATVDMIPHYDKRTDEPMRKATEKLVEA